MEISMTIFIKKKKYNFNFSSYNIKKLIEIWLTINFFIEIHFFLFFAINHIKAPSPTSTITNIISKQNLWG